MRLNASVEQQVSVEPYQIGRSLADVLLEKHRNLPSFWDAACTSGIRLVWSDEWEKQHPEDAEMARVANRLVDTNKV